MEERSYNYADDDRDITLEAPRFDDDDALRASPVVPLEELRSRRPPVRQERFRAGARRRWPLSLVVVALLAVVTVGAVAAKVIRRNHGAPVASAASAPAEPTQQAAQAQPPADSTSPKPDATAQAQAAPATNDGRAEADAEHTSRRAHEMNTSRWHEEREARAVRPAPLPPPEVARVERAPVEGGDEKDLKRQQKHGKKEARLFDVIVSPRRH
jgi:hypothetical protein